MQAVYNLLHHSCLASFCSDETCPYLFYITFDTSRNPPTVVGIQGGLTMHNAFELVTFEVFSRPDMIQDQQVFLAENYVVGTYRP